jgi:hypothetical protein
MKRLAMVLMTGVFAAAALPCAAQLACPEVAVETRIEAGQGALTLADLLEPDLLESGACVQLRQAATQVSLGAAPRVGSTRVLDGGQVRRLLEGLEGGSRKIVGTNVPERIVIERAGATKSCVEIARFVASATPSKDMAGARSRWQQDLDCAGARGIAAEAVLELTKSSWNAALQRREFALRCVRPEDCVPFLVWVHEEKTARAQVADAPNGASRRFAPSSSANSAGHLVKPGQTAMLTWDESGIRVVLPVTCLDAGAMGQLVRVQFKNTARILRAEVVGDGTVRATL